MTRDPGWRRQRFAGAGTRRSERGFAADHSPLAETPSEIPARGWKDMLPRVYARITECRVIAVAAGVSFYALLAIFPAIAALISIYGLFADPATMASHLDSISSFVPGGAIEVIRDEMHRVAAQGARTLGLAFVLSLGVSLWSANAGIKALFDALNIVHGEREKRGFVRLNLISLGFTLAAIVFLLLALALVAVVPVALQYIGLESATERVLKIARWPLLFVTVSLALSVLYRYGRGHRIHDLDLAVHDRDPRGSDDRRRDGAPNGPRRDGDGLKTDGTARRRNRGHRRWRAGLSFTSVREC